MSRVDVQCVDPRNSVCTLQRVQEPSLIQVEPIYLLSLRAYHSIARRRMIRQASSVRWYPSRVEDRAGSVNADASISLKMERLRPVVGKDLEIYIFCIRNSLALQAQFEKVVNLESRLVGSCCKTVLTISSRSDLIASFGKVKVLG